MMEITSEQRTAVIVTFVVYTIVMLVLSKLASSASKGNANVNKFADDYFASGRGLGGLVVGLTAGAALCSAGTFVAVPGACSIMGFSYALLVFFSAPVSFVICAEAGKKIGVVSRRCGAVWNRASQRTKSTAETMAMAVNKAASR